MNYAEQLFDEWKQCRDEGRDVYYLKDLCSKISARAEKENLNDFALKIRGELVSSPISEDYPFEEPSELAEIQAAAPKKRHDFSLDISREELLDKLSGAWIGRISGCLLGKPIEGVMRTHIEAVLKQTGNYPMTRYIERKDFDKESEEHVKDHLDFCWADTINGISPSDDDTNYTVLAMKLIEEYGRDFRPNDVLEAWLRWLPMFTTYTAERAAYRNAATGLYAPETATYLNPYREWIGAQIRGDFFGYINPAKPHEAAAMAWRDASISHVRNGIYGEMFVSAMIAAASATDSVMETVEAGLDEIPENCRLRRDIDKVIQWKKDGLSVFEVTDEIHKAYDEYDRHGWCHTNPNAMIVVMALLYGEKDFTKTLGYAVQAAFDTDCNGATVGSIIGMMLGEKKIPEYWYSRYNKKLETDIVGYSVVDVDGLAEKTLSLIGG